MSFYGQCGEASTSIPNRARSRAGFADIAGHPGSATSTGLFGRGLGKPHLAMICHVPHYQVSAALLASQLPTDGHRFCYQRWWPWLSLPTPTRPFAPNLQSAY